MSKYTPGPWRLSGFFPNRVCGDRSDAEGKFVADCDCNGNADRNEEDAANARLIAAAPELFEFLEEFIEAWDNGMAGDSYLMRIAATVRAKATGESQ